MEKYIEKKLPRTSVDDDESRRIKSYLENVELSHLRTKSFDASRIWHAINDTNEHLLLASVVAESCGEDMVVGYSSEAKESIRQHVMLSKETARRFFDIEEVHRVNLRMDTQFRKSLREVINLAADCTTACPLKVGPKSRSLPIMTKYVDELFKITMEKLVTSHNDEQRRLNYINDIIERSKKSHALITSLEKQLDDAIKVKDEILTNLDSHIEQLIQDATVHQNHAKEEHDRLWAKASKGITSIGESHKGATCELRRYFHGLQKTLEDDRRKDCENEKQLRKKCYKIETEVSNWIAKYDKTMGRLQKEIDEVLELQALHRPGLVKLEGSFAILKAKYKEIMEERIQKQDMIDKRIETFRLKVWAAIRIQSYWRGYKIRKGNRKAMSRKKRKEKKISKKKKK